MCRCVCPTSPVSCSMNRWGYALRARSVGRRCTYRSCVGVREERTQEQRWRAILSFSCIEIAAKRRDDPGRPQVWSHCKFGARPLLWRDVFVMRSAACTYKIGWALQLSQSRVESRSPIRRCGCDAEQRKRKRTGGWLRAHGMAWHGMAWHGMAWQLGSCLALQAPLDSGLSGSRRLYLPHWGSVMDTATATVIVQWN